MLQIGGELKLGGTLRCLGDVVVSGGGRLQWSWVGAQGAMQPIAGATRAQYAPEPADVGRVIACTYMPQNGEVRP